MSGVDQSSNGVRVNIKTCVMHIPRLSPNQINQNPSLSHRRYVKEERLPLQSRGRTRKLPLFFQLTLADYPHAPDHTTFRGQLT
jgi:hypothetical protein